MRALLASLVLVGAAATSLPASAQQLTNIRITRVESQGGGVETYASTTPTTTARDHDGINGRVTIREIGIGTNRIVRMAGDLISPDYQLSSTNICGTPTAPTTPCRAGQTIIGQDIVYRFDGYPNGLFDYRVRSSSGSQTYLQTTINIK